MTVIDPARAKEAAADVLRTARHRRGMTQRDLAAAAGIPQSMIARFESGRSQPTFPTLTRLLAAAGYAPTIDLVSTVRPGPLLAEHAEEIRDLARAHRITRVRVFGSVARGDDGPTSDVDILVDFDSSATLFDQASFRDQVAQLLGVDVDVVDSEALSLPRDRDIVEEARDL